LNEKNKIKNNSIQFRVSLSKQYFESQSDTTFISEPGLYFIVLSSRMPAAEPFVRWVTEKVLPSIRKTKKYETLHEDNPLSDIQEKLNEPYATISQMYQQLLPKD
jgi:prophage antirepressor-like protein